MNKRVLITGGFGYLGGRIAVELKRVPGFTVRLGSRKANSAPYWLPDAETVNMDVREPASLSSAMHDVQAVVHLAAMNENECVAAPGKAILVNTLGTLNALQSAIDANVERFIYFSTAHVYGAPLVGHITEETLPRPVHPYAITHHAAEDFVLAAHDQKKITGVVVRLSNGFGAPTHPNVDRWTLLVNDLCRQAVTTGKLVLRSSGIQRRDFIPLTDVGCAVVHILNLAASECNGGLFNLGGGCSMRIIDMVKHIADRCKVSLGFDPPVLHPDPTEGEASEMLKYSVDKLLATGFTLTGDPMAEIDATLRLCWATYGGDVR